MKASVFDERQGVYTIACHFDEKLLTANQLLLKGTKGEITLGKDNIVIEKRFCFGIPENSRIYARGISFEDTIGELKEVEVIA